MIGSMPPSMVLNSVDLLHIRRRLAKPFRISVGEITTREFIVLRGNGEGFTVYGEVNIDARPFYTEEYISSAWEVIGRDLLPAVLGKPMRSAQEVAGLWPHVRGHQFAKAGIEALFWDLEGQCAGVPISDLIGGRPGVRLPIGTSHSIFPTPEELVAEVERAVAIGIPRIKLKIQPGWDFKPLSAVRRAFPDIQLMADANAAYSSDHVTSLAALDAIEMLMLEQPFPAHDFVSCQVLKMESRTPLCLDESLHDADMARTAIALGVLDIANIKVGRVGGLSEALAIQALCQTKGIPLWCGRRTGAGVSIALELAMASLPGFVYPTDHGIEFVQETLDHFVDLAAFDFRDGSVTVPTGPGLGVAVDSEMLEHLTVNQASFPGP